MARTETTARFASTVVVPNVTMSTSRTAMATGQQKAIADRHLREAWHDSMNSQRSVWPPILKRRTNATPKKHPRRKNAWWSCRQLFQWYRRRHVISVAGSGEGSVPTSDHQITKKRRYMKYSEV